jgi:hypothetical protein
MHRARWKSSHLLVRLRYTVKEEQFRIVRGYQMDRESFTSAIEAFQTRKPFKPFTVALVDGERYEVDRPNVIALGEGAAVLFAPGNVPVFFDHEGVSQVIGDLSGRGAEAT